MSYICKASSLKAQKNIANLEKNILSTNPYLKHYFDKATFIFDKPLSISNLQFDIKSPIFNHMLIIGDAAGNIAPLSGNGMSIGMLSAKLCGEAILKYLNKEISYDALENLYASNYHDHFSQRIKVAKKINNFFGKKLTTDVGICLLKIFPFVLDNLSKKIHGDTF